MTAVVSCQHSEAERGIQITISQTTFSHYLNFILLLTYPFPPLSPYPQSILWLHLLSETR